MSRKSNFYPNGEFIHYTLPDSYALSKTKQSCGNCAMYSNRRSFCGVWKAQAVKDTYICHKWRMRYFKR